MFKIAQSPTYWIDVGAEVTAENGARVPVKFRAKVKRLDEEHWSAIRAKAAEVMRDGSSGDDYASREIVVDLDEIVGDDPKEKLSFSSELLESVLANGMGTPIIASYLESRPRAKRKN